MFNHFFDFEKKPVKEIIRLLFLIGNVPIAIYAISIGRMAAITFLVQKMVPANYGMYTSAMETNYLLGFVVAVIVFGVAVMLWKLVCELLLLIFRSLELYIQSNSQKDDEEQKASEQ
ncbi:hypothetical protein [Brevibacillus sp. NRS-1366]|uniref:hypothetical protein n=1 Tax=Brevibacillus sp. NRS-1366 TaxID=3233899 RepID=UPI003D250659